VAEADRACPHRHAELERRIKAPISTRSVSEAVAEASDNHSGKDAGSNRPPILVVAGVCLMRGIQLQPARQSDVKSLGRRPRFPSFAHRRQAQPALLNCEMASPCHVRLQSQPLRQSATEGTAHKTSFYLFAHRRDTQRVCSSINRGLRRWGPLTWGFAGGFGDWFTGGPKVPPERAVGLRTGGSQTGGSGGWW